MPKPIESQSNIVFYLVLSSKDLALFVNCWLLDRSAVKVSQAAIAAKAAQAAAAAKSTQADEATHQLVKKDY